MNKGAPIKKQMALRKLNFSPVFDIFIFFNDSIKISLGAPQ
jgi:hypothetical protein